jgi:large subunit ribosomal protein L15
VAELNVGQLGAFAPGTEVDEAALRGAGLVKGRPDVLKLLGGGSLDRALTVRVHRVSAAARAKVEAAGGTVSLIGSAE